jgi:hypothetical protein
MSAANTGTAAAAAAAAAERQTGVAVPPSDTGERAASGTAEMRDAKVTAAFVAATSSLPPGGGGGAAFEVEAIVGRRRAVGGTREYLVKWRGRTSAFSSWTPLAQLDGCRDALREFRRSQNTRRRLAAAGGVGRAARPPFDDPFASAPTRDLRPRVAPASVATVDRLDSHIPPPAVGSRPPTGRDAPVASVPRAPHVATGAAPPVHGVEHVANKKSALASAALLCGS